MYLENIALKYIYIYMYIFFLSASQPIMGLNSHPFHRALASSFEVSSSHTTTRHSR